MPEMNLPALACKACFATYPYKPTPERAAVDVSPKIPVWYLKASCLFYALAASGKHSRLSATAVPVQSMPAFWNGRKPGFLRSCGNCDLPSTTSLKASPGDGKALDQTQRIGGKNGSKRHLGVDGRGVPLSLVVTGANRHDVTQLEPVLDAIMVDRPSPPIRRHKHLCPDAGYTGAPALKVIEAHGYIPHVKGRGQEAKELKHSPEKKARPF